MALCALAVANVVADPCTPAQLAGNFNSFRFTGSGGSYVAGSQQVVSFDHPLGSPIVTLTDVNVVAVSNGVPSDPAILSGVPKTFAQNVDVGASVSLVLPALLTSGIYFYRANLMSGSTACTLDSLPFTVTSDDVVPPMCTDGARQCLSASTYSVCDGGVWGVGQVCSAGTQCTGQGLCTLQSGNPNDCVEGTYTCSGDMSPEYSLCGYDVNGDLVEIPLSCQESTFCVQHGAVVTCELGSTPDECTANQRRCVTQTSFQMCESCDNGSLEWGPTQQCGVGQTCNNGICGFQSVPPVGEPCEINGHMQCVEGGDGTEFLTCDQNVSVSRNCADGTVCRSYMTDYIICDYPTV